MKNTNNQNTYRLPPKAIIDLIDAPPTPGVSISPDGKHILLFDRLGLPGIEEVARKELRLAGIRINPKTYGPSRSGYFTGIQVKKEEGFRRVNGLPQNCRIRNLSWSADSAKLAFTLTSADGIALWYLDLDSLRVKQLTGPILNDTVGSRAYRWLPKSRQLVVKAKVPALGEPPSRNPVPTGPVIQENLSKEKPVRTYQDLLKDAHDEELFAFYATSQFLLADLEGNLQTISKPDLYRAAIPSPCGKYLLVYRINRPFSYNVPYGRFPFSVMVWTVEGQFIREVADVPLADDIPKGFGAVRKGPRAFTWRSDKPTSLYWVETQDGGDPKKEVAVRDKLFYLEPPFTGKTKESIHTNLRFGGITWGKDELAIVEEWRWQDRRLITSRFSPSNPSQPSELLFDLSWEDLYQDPGGFVTRINAFGSRELMIGQDDKTLYMIGDGHSPEGKRPFIDRFDLEGKEKTRLWQNEGDVLEVPVSYLNPDAEILITKRETADDPPNFYFRKLTNGKLEAITHFPHPYESLKAVRRELVFYQRKDGVQLQGQFYLPPGYDQERDGSLPLVMWAYPKEYKSSQAAGQVSTSPHQFIRLSSHSPLVLLTQGYAVLNGFSMPVVGEGEEEPNDQFVEQIVDNTRAAIDYLAGKGWVDPGRVAIGGHSYGAFMTANLLAHSDLFKAGIARSGAYNRTLTPFGFQSEERTFWEAQETYIRMSPFAFADKIKAPILLIHGEVDNNPGTFPMQSERFYAALKGHGATARLVVLPEESHGYQARESILHMWWEITRWLDKYLR